MANFTLDDIRAAAEAKYGSTDIDLGGGEILRLVNPLRLSKEKRDRLTSIQNDLDAEDADQGDVMREAIRIVADDGEKAERFLGYVGDDLALLATVFETYSGDAQVGEA